MNRDAANEPTPERDTSGQRGTYGCACVSRDARNCILQRYGWCGNFGRTEEPCECICHQWSDDDAD
jgi:hypothetical protein